MNLQRGFRRVFVILWLLYIVSVVLYPFYEDEREWPTTSLLARVEYDACMNAAKGGDYSGNMRVCMNAFSHAGLGATWKNIWEQNGWHPLWAAPVVFLVPPLIVYGVLWLLVKAGVSVAKG